MSLTAAAGPSADSPAAASGATTSSAAASGERQRTGVAVALGALYFIWGSTYLAIAVAIETIPPFLMGGIRFLLAGALLYGFLRWRGAAAPTYTQWRGSALVGTLLLLGGNGGVAYAEQWVASGVAAVVIATTPLWAAFFAGLWGRWPTKVEWVGLALGLAGVVLLNLGGDLRAHPAGAAALVVAAATWALGTVVSGRVPQAGGMMATAAQLLTGGAVLVVASALLGERMPALPSTGSLAAFAYLVVVGSLVGYSCFIYLLGRVRPTLATSYAYVNPIVAVALGAALAGEAITGTMIVSMIVILGGVGLVAVARERGGKR